MAKMIGKLSLKCRAIVEQKAIMKSFGAWRFEGKKPLNNVTL